MNGTNFNQTQYFLNLTTNVFNDTLYGNISLQDYILLNRGPKYLPLKIVVPITIIYGVIFLSGLIGNLAVCFVIATNTTMHTATNYYLFSLALSDFVLLVLGLPNDLSVYWQQYPWVLGLLICKTRALVSEMSSYVSVLTIVAFSLERYVAICHPLTSYKINTFGRVIRIIICLWLISFICASPFAIYTTVNYIDYPPGSGIPVIESAFCAMLKTNMPPNIPLYELSSVIFFVFPALIIILIYTRIGKTIKKDMKVDGCRHGRLTSTQSKKTIITMLMAVVVTFFVCWAPFHMQRLMYIHMSNHPAFHLINMWMYYITGMLYYFSATVNPILYNVMSARYRSAFKQTLFCKKTKYDCTGTSTNKDSNGKELNEKRLSLIQNNRVRPLAVYEEDEDDTQT